MTDVALNKPIDTTKDYIYCLVSCLRAISTLSTINLIDYNACCDEDFKVIFTFRISKTTPQSKEQIDKILRAKSFHFTTKEQQNIITYTCAWIGDDA